METDDNALFNEGLLNTPLNELKQSFIYKYLKFTESKVTAVLKKIAVI